MAINTQSQTVNTTVSASRQVSVPKEIAVQKEVEKSVSSVETVKYTARQVADIQAKDEKPLEISKESLQAAVNKLQDYVDKYNRDLKFSIDDDTGRTVVRLLDGDSNVVKQYPSEDILSIISNLEQNKGLFIGEA